MIAFAALIEDHEDLLKFDRIADTFQEEMFRIARAILPDHQLAEDALLHFYVFDQSVREIADLFGRKVSTVRRELSRGRRLLAEICRKEGIFND